VISDVKMSIALCGKNKVVANFASWKHILVGQNNPQRIMVCVHVLLGLLSMTSEVKVSITLWGKNKVVPALH